MTQLNIRILSALEDVARYVHDVQTASDEERTALGFLPKRAYSEAADQGKLLVAVLDDHGRSIYAGHLLYGGVFPHARIFQVFTPKEFRRRGIARRLVETLVRRAEMMQFMSVVAKVADDLIANQFWDTLAFDTVRTKLGRGGKRKINVRLRELEGPRLFPRALAPIQQAADLKLVSRILDIAPIYLLDLNVLYDLLRKRANAKDVGRILRASFTNTVRLALAQEFIEELERTSVPSPTDPVLELARNLPRLSSPPADRLHEILGPLGKILFPVQVASGRLRPQDRSDLTHLATAIWHGASGFITSEKAILRGRDALQLTYSLEIVGTNEFAATVDASEPLKVPQVRAASGGGFLRALRARREDQPSIETFLLAMKCSAQAIQTLLKEEPGRQRCTTVVSFENQVVGVGSWEIPRAIKPHMQAFVCVDEDHARVSLVAEFLLDRLNAESLAGHPIQINLNLLPGHVATKRVALALGFRPSADAVGRDSGLGKIALGRIVTPRNWKIVARFLRNKMGLHLPERMPQYHAPLEGFPIRASDGHMFTLSLEEVETLFSPCLFLLPSRPAAIVPIRRIFAADLLGNAIQPSLLESQEAVLLNERVYFSSPRTAHVLTKGTPILFYESARGGGRGGVTTFARAVKSQVLSKSAANHDLLRRGVLDSKTLERICLDDTVVATKIDNIMPLRNSVGLARLRQLEAIDGANLVTARRLKPEQASRIAEEGSEHAMH